MILYTFLFICAGQMCSFNTVHFIFIYVLGNVCVLLIQYIYLFIWFWKSVHLIQYTLPLYMSMDKVFTWFSILYLYNCEGKCVHLIQKLIFIYDREMCSLDSSLYICVRVGKWIHLIQYTYSVYMCREIRSLDSVHLSLHISREMSSSWFSKFIFLFMSMGNIFTWFSALILIYE